MSIWSSLDKFSLPIAVLIAAVAIALACIIFVIPSIFLYKTEFKSITALYKNEKDKATTPIQNFCVHLDTINYFVGQLISWLVLMMVLMQFVVVLLRYVFYWGSVQMQESIWYMHGLIFTLAVGYTFLKEGHVRIDIFYRNLPEYRKALINFFGSTFFIFPVCIVTLYMAYPYVVHSWDVFEGSTEGTGLHYVYLLKTSILLFAILLLLQGISLWLKSLEVILKNNQSTHSL